MGTLPNSEDQDEMQQYAAFHQSRSALFAKIKTTVNFRSDVRNPKTILAVKQP